ncbi:MAG: adenylate/guanylate cyclase domain-containing protein [Candidatus Gastranaerophilaceae bacterium]
MKKFKNKLFYICTAFIYLFMVSVTLVLSSVFLDANIRNFFVSKFSANSVGSYDIINIVIDDSSLAKYPMPWSKNLYRELLAYFSEYAKPKIIGFDILFSNNFNPMNKADVDFVNTVSKMDNLVSGFSPESGDTLDDERKIFMETLSKKHSVNVDYRAYDAVPFYYKSEVIPQMYFDSVKSLASVKINADSISGTTVSDINLLKIGDSYYPSLPFRMYLLENNTNDIIVDDNFIIVPKTGLKIPHKLILKSWVETDLKFYKNIVVKNKNGYIKSDYTHISIPAYKIIESYRHLKSGKLMKDDLAPELFNGKVIFIGANINGPSADVLKTPMGNRHPGVDIQATMYDNLSNNQFLHSAHFLVRILAIVLLAVFAFVAVLRYSFLKSLTLIILCDLIFFVLVAACAYNNYILSFINPIMVQVTTLIFGYSFKFISENRNKEKIKQAMGKYLSQDIMKNVVNNIDDLKLGGKRAVVTVLFSDIRGFTSLSEKMPAEEVSMILNEYFSEMEPIITKYNGVINKFIGDAVMAIFGEPIQDINHPQNAVKCAYEMLKTVEYLREKWLYEGKPKIEIGVGINTGEVFIGNIGTETRMEYTVIGDTVNLASRIESYNKVYKTNLLVSSSTYEHIADIADVIKISEVQIRGKAKKMNIYEVLRIGIDKK